MTLRILIVDDHEVVRLGLSTLLERHPGFTVVDEAATAREAVQKALLLRPDVVVMDAVRRYLCRGVRLRAQANRQQ